VHATLATKNKKSSTLMLLSILQNAFDYSSQIAAVYCEWLASK
jgi:hypothetical protein